MLIEELLHQTHELLSAELAKQPTLVITGQNVFDLATATSLINDRDYRTLSDLFRRFGQHDADLTSLKHFKDFLTNRWEDIRQTDAAYTNLINDPMTKICISLAQALSTVFPESTYQLLMPTVKFFTNDWTGTSWDELKLSEFILSDDDTTVIEISSCLEYAMRYGQLLHTKLYHGEKQKGLPKDTRSLSETEYLRLVKHSAQVSELVKAIACWVDFSVNGNSIGAQINRLVIGLNDGGANSHLIGDGSEFNSGKDANSVIADFYEFLRILKKSYPDLLANLYSRRETGRTLTFQDFWKRLSNPTNRKEYDETDCVKQVDDHMDGVIEDNQDLYDYDETHCVEQVGHHMSSILDCNQDLYDIEPGGEEFKKIEENTCNNIKQRIFDAKLALSKAIESDQYQVLFGYGAEKSALMLYGELLKSIVLFLKIVRLLPDQKVGDQNEVTKKEWIMTMSTNQYALMIRTVYNYLDLIQYTPATLQNILLISIGPEIACRVMQDIYDFQTIILVLKPENIMDFLKNNIGSEHLRKIVNNVFELKTAKTIIPENLHQEFLELLGKKHVEKIFGLREAVLRLSSFPSKKVASKANTQAAGHGKSNQFFVKPVKVDKCQEEKESKENNQENDKENNQQINKSAAS